MSRRKTVAINFNEPAPHYTPPLVKIYRKSDVETLGNVFEDKSHQIIQLRVRLKVILLLTN